jgi:dolichyl-phosphate-mannose-protein mannosyltransferase
MFAHLLDHFVFSSRRLRTKTKAIVFGTCAFSIIACFWWFKGLAFGVDGPITDHWGLEWRKVMYHQEPLIHCADAAFLVLEYI